MRAVTATMRLAAAAMALLDTPVLAQSLPAVRLSGDARLRLEDDWDSHTPTDVERPERGRARIRARLEADADLGDGVRAQARVRTGAEHSQQNANITFADFNGNPVDVFKLSLDRWSLAWRRGGGGVEAGRMAFPFFTSNEYFWDADISPLGAAVTVPVAIGSKTRLRLIGGGFALPVGLAYYSGHLFAGQAVVDRGALTAAAGLFRFAADRRDPDRLLQLDNNGSRDYTVLAVDLRYGLRAGAKPLVVTADLFRNLQGYRTDPDPISRRYAKDRTGIVLGIAWGDIAAAHHLQVGARYFRMEKLAVDASYSHDDLARLGTASQAALTDLEGEDIYINHALSRRVTAGFRLVNSHRLTSAEDDKRARLDLSYAFGS